jgi:hypothetical protein
MSIKNMNLFILLNLTFICCNSQTRKEETKKLLVGKYHIYERHNCSINFSLLPDTLLLFLSENGQYYFNIENSVTKQAKGSWDISSENDEFAYFFFTNADGKTIKTRILRIPFLDAQGNKCEIGFAPVREQREQREH